jgi:hypothetical protein
MKRAAAAMYLHTVRVDVERVWSRNRNPRVAAGL